MSVVFSKRQIAAMPMKYQFGLYCKMNWLVDVNFVSIIMLKLTFN